MKFYSELENLLKTEPSFWDKDQKRLVKTKIINAAYQLDTKLITLLLKEEKFKQKFFSEIQECWIFNVFNFVDFIKDKNFLNDSYSDFKNYIGLSVDGERLKERGDVALNFPYKDCILEGGQSTEEQKRKEIFFNQLLAQDEIDQLQAPKVLTHCRKYSTKGIEKFTSFKRDMGIIKDNLIIKGNNFLALHCLLEQFEEKVKLIYIDPPYNTGNGTNSFKYNDNFNHSAWLTFMKNRLEAAKKLLRDDGVIFVQCDDNEQAYLKVLMDEIFGRDNFVGEIVRKVSSSARLDAKHISIETDKILIYSKNINLLILNRNIYKLEGYNLIDKHQENRGKYKLNKLDRGSISYSKKMDYPITSPDGKKIYPGEIDKQNGWCWRWSREKFNWGKKNDFITFKEINNRWSVYFKQYEFVDNNLNKIKRSIPYKNLLLNYYNEIGTEEHLSLFSDKLFSNPKPEKLLQRIIEISTQEGDIILDYHLGSGTTAAVAHKMGRQYIGVEQMDYIESIAVERLKKVIAGEQGGISQAVNWQGGGEFVYFELKKYNQKFIEEIATAESTKQLEKIWQEMKEKSFLDYNVDLRKQVEAFEEWKKLELKEQKQALVDLLNKNQLYVNYSEIDDKDFCVVEDEKKASHNFYNQDRATKDAGELKV